MVELKSGDIFTTECDAIVNAVNCVGVMGAGIALVFKTKFPAMFKAYKIACANGEVKVGKIWIYELNQAERTGYKFSKILNFPTKEHFKNRSKVEFLELGLANFAQIYKLAGISSVAFVLLGAGKGGLNEQISLEILKRNLKNLDIYAEIWQQK